MLQVRTKNNESLSVFIGTKEQSQLLQLTQQDSLLVLDLLDDSPTPNAKLMAVAFDLPKDHDVAS